MNAPRRKLPIGIQTFSEIICEGHYYVDKTRLIHDLIANGKYYFLSRPRRFGKSLLIDTLKELFEGKQELFKGLHIHDLWDWTTRFPVIRISFNSGGLKNSADLQKRMLSILKDNFARLGLPQADLDDPIIGFERLIRSARTHYGQRVAILVDEYDKPILDTIHDSVIALDMRDTLKGFYSVIKGADEDIRFAIVTGVSKFSKVSLFSGLNNLEDITLNPAFSAICGYTDKDVDSVFAPELAGLDREQIRHWYNGYNWRGESVYNPFDLLLLFKRREFDAYWFDTATPSFLIELMAQRGFFTPDLANLRTGAELLSAFEVDRIRPEALLFQTGYLTIKEAVQSPSGYWKYTLGYPNREVEASLNASLLAAYTPPESESGEHQIRLQDLLEANDIAGMRALFHAFFAGIPHQWHTNNPIARFEGYYASVFYTYFAASGYPVRVEDATNKGRIDMAVKLPVCTYLFEFKVVELVPGGKALQQLKERGYAEKYRADGLPIYLIGVEFSSKHRNVVGFEVELA